MFTHILQIGSYGHAAIHWIAIHDTGQIIEPTQTKYPIQQYLADGDPDVDAIYRLIYKDELFFEKNFP